MTPLEPDRGGGRDDIAPLFDQALVLFRRGRLARGRKPAGQPMPRVCALSMPRCRSKVNLPRSTTAELEYVEIKGVRTRDWLLKWKLFDALQPETRKRVV
jgi:hypothetical protein